MCGGRLPGRATGLCGLTAIIAVLVPACADAAWLGYKNNTPAAVVIQASDVVVVNGKVQQIRPGKPHPLYPGEVAWDAIAAPGKRIITVYDPKTNRQVYQDWADCNNKIDLFLSLQFITPPQVKGQPPPQPVLKLVPIPVPQLPKNQLPPGFTPSSPSGGSSPSNPQNTAKGPGR
jgi:hypothetical protein